MTDGFQQTAVKGFVVRMDSVRGRKGVLLTTSSFSQDGIDCVERIEGTA